MGRNSAQTDATSAELAADITAEADARPSLEKMLELLEVGEKLRAEVREKYNLDGSVSQQKLRFLVD